MSSRPRPLLLLALLALTAGGLGACGGDEGGDESVDTLLRQTFSGSKNLRSGRLAVSVKIDAKGLGNLDGPVAIKLDGPFQSQGARKIPKFALDVSFSGGGQNIAAGATSTGNAGFLKFQGRSYVLSDELFAQFRKGFTQARAQGEASPSTSLATLGINPRNWLRDAKDEGEQEVAGAKTRKISGTVDVARLLDDINRALSRASSLGLGGGAQQRLPTKITAAQKRKVVDAVREAKVQIYTGAEDKILRRLTLQAEVKAAGGSAGVDLDVQIADLNEPQTITAPPDPKPLQELLDQFGSGGGLGALGGLGSGSGSGSSGSGSGGSNGSSGSNLDKYSDCLEKAGSDIEKAQDCAELLTP